MLVDTAISNAAGAIDKNLGAITRDNVGLVAQNVLSHCRNLFEYTMLKAKNNGANVEVDWEALEGISQSVAGNSKLRFLCQFHKCLQIVASHYTLDEDSSQRLLLKYLDYLYQIRTFLDENYGIKCLYNLYKVPTSDSLLLEYYRQIGKAIKGARPIDATSIQGDRYYVESIKPFFVDNEVYYQVTLAIANDRIDKTDRVIAFTEQQILENYAIMVNFSRQTITVGNQHIGVLVIRGWKVAIRPCELSAMAEVFGIDYTTNGRAGEYRALMSLLTRERMSINDLVSLPQPEYQPLLASISRAGSGEVLIALLNNIRKFTRGESMPGENVVRYLSWNMRHRVIKNQLSDHPSSALSNLYLQNGCIPFDKMPFCTSLLKHNPRRVDLLGCIPYVGREHEFFASTITHNAEDNGIIFQDKGLLKEFDNPELLAKEYNDRLYCKHQSRRIENIHGNYYIRGYAADVKGVLSILESRSNHAAGYQKEIDRWLLSHQNSIDDPEKAEALKRLFNGKSVGFVYGPAGTGKTKLISYFVEALKQHRFLMLAQTNAAVENLKSKVYCTNYNAMTIDSYLNRNESYLYYEIIVIDESSTVSNSDMLKVLNKTKATQMLLVGDEYQIESIRFGNWFFLTHTMGSRFSTIDLTNTYRTNDCNLLRLWQVARKWWTTGNPADQHIAEFLDRNGYSHAPDNDILKPRSDDEIILCLGYDGLYGINNLNLQLQDANDVPKGKLCRRGIKNFKVNDPILFKADTQFEPVVHNNTKGRIANISLQSDKALFDIELYIEATKEDVEAVGLKFLYKNSQGHVFVRLPVFKRDTSLDDFEMQPDNRTLIPFQVAYAISIHKSQGLEYESVKVVIPEGTEDSISFNIFYTAITRAKKYLRIYWTPEVEYRVLSGFAKRSPKKDISLLRQVDVDGTPR